MFKIVKRADGTLETAEAAGQTEAELREQIARERAELRAMLEGNVAFHVDPMAAPSAPAESDYAAIVNLASTESASEADTPAPTAQESAKPLVVRYMQDLWHIGNGIHKMQFRCDAEGWISHTPTADAACPVPEGIEFEARTRDGQPIRPDADRRHYIWWSLARNSGQSRKDITSWRPVVQ